MNLAWQNLEEIKRQYKILEKTPGVVILLNPILLVESLEDAECSIWFPTTRGTYISLVETLDDQLNKLVGRERNTLQPGDGYHFISCD